MAKAEKQIEVADYENTIQTAFGEVSNALTEAPYKAGTDSILTFLDAQRTLYTAQQQHATDTLSRQANLVTLYKILAIKVHIRQMRADEQKFIG